MSMNQRRGSQRVTMELPVEIHWKNRVGGTRQALGKTGDISGSGLFIETSTRPKLSTPVSLKVLLPREVTQVPMELRCWGRVVRWNQRGQSQGLGAVIDEYELCPVQKTEPAPKSSPRKH
jgi:hypothetical protein